MNAFRRRSRSERRGTATVELAMVAPALFLFVFAAIEFSRACMMRNTCEIAAVQGARAGIVAGATAAECEAAALAELTMIGVTGASATVNPSTLSDGDLEVTVTVSIPVAANGYVFPRFFLGKTIDSAVTLRRETPSFK